MKSSATTPAAYLASLPPERREAIETVRAVILDNLSKDLIECMQYGVIAYCVPHSVWPHGHHTHPELPLMYMGLSSQKNDMVVYMLCLFRNQRMREWFEKTWKATGKKLHMDVAGMACCLRFRKVEDLSLDVIAETMRRMPVPTYLEDHTAMLAGMGKGPNGKPIKGAAKKSTAKKPAGASGARAKPRTPRTTKKKQSSRRTK